MLHEHHFNYEKVKEVYNKFIFELKIGMRTSDEVAEHLKIMLSLRFSKDSPRSAP